MSSLRKQALVRLLVCAVVFIATIVFCFLLLTGAFDGGSSADPSTTPESASTAEGVASDSIAAEGEVPGDAVEATPEPTPEPTPSRPRNPRRSTLTACPSSPPPSMPRVSSRPLP